MNTSRMFRAGFYLCAVGLLVLAAPARGTNITWTNQVSPGNWSVAGNWHPNEVPGTGDNVYLTNSFGSYVVHYDTLGEAFGNLWMKNTGGTTTLNIDVDTPSDANHFTIPFVSPNYGLDIGGVLRVNAYARIGHAVFPAKGRIVVTAGGHADIRGTGNMAFTGPGDMIIVEEGGTFAWTPNSAVMGANTDARHVVRGNMFLGTYASLWVASQSRAYFLVENGGNLNVRKEIRVGNNGTHVAIGTFTLREGTVTNAGRLEISANMTLTTHSGKYSHCDVQIENGLWNNLADTVVAGLAPYRTGLSDANTYADYFTANTLGTVHQTNGTFMTPANVYVANGPSQGTIFLEGGDFLVTNATESATMYLTSMFSADNSLTMLGTGTLHVAGGNVTVDRLVATNGANSRIQFDAGTIAAKQIDIDNGSAALTIGDGASAATLNLLGGTHDVAAGLVINTNATLTVQGTGVTGSATVTGDLTFTTNSTLAVDLLGLTAGTEYDQLTVTGDVDLGNSDLHISLGFEPKGGQTFTLINNASATPTLGAFANGDSLTAEYAGITYGFSIDTAGGIGDNDVVLSVRPRGTSILIR